MPVRVDDRWSYAGLPVVRIENAALVADIVPSLGGKVLHLVDKRADRNVLWRHPRIPPHAGPLQANVMTITRVDGTTPSPPVRRARTGGETCSRTWERSGTWR